MKKIFLIGQLVIFVFILYCQIVIASDIHERVYSVGKIPKGYKLIPESLVPSPKLKHLGFVCISQDKRKMLAVIDNKPTIEFNRIAKNYPRFSPEGKHYIIVGKIGSKAYLLFDNQLSKPYDLIYKAFFTKDGKLLYIAKENNLEFLIVDGKKWNGYKRIAEKISPVVSNNNKKIAIVALKNNGKTTINVNNKELGEYDLVLNPVFSPDSSHIAYIVKIGQKYRVILDDKYIGGEYQDIKDLTFSPNSKRFAFVAREGRDFFLVLDGNEQKRYQFVGQPLFSPDGNHIAYMAYENKKMFIVIDKKPGPKLDQIGIYSFTGNNELVYMGVKDNKGAIFVNNKPEKFYDSVGLPVPSPDGKHLAYRARMGKKWFVVYDSKKGPEFDLVRRPKFSPDGKHLAYIAVKDNNYFMVIDNKEQKKYLWVDFPYFSSDGNHVAYVAKDKKGTFIVVDGMESRERFLGFLKGVPLYFFGNCVRGQALKLPGPEFYKVEVCF